ncbi:glycoside hydrolase family 127 protein [Couchioplanes caeruleus]|uniref:glycoside hydrolase family 127 protein n=1 Tax=Couchioplanes caeruleus TaxID=56438 RepID=UPI0020BEF677|nr:beta-L-arabinofuranosidase domain-containing protein [Couchioplanes caeruleus]UQU62996.1 glycoside hydrolase family 127 protein [Couchioplanes caeruleus]
MTGPLVPTPDASCRLRPVTTARLDGGLLAERQRVNGEAAVPSGHERLRAAGNLDNLRIAAGEAAGELRGPVFMDSDVYKWLEAAAWEYARAPRPALLEAQRAVTAVVAAAQRADGYLNSMVRERYRDLPWSHEHYCAGHLMQAAVAQSRATGDKALLEVAVRFADHLVATFGPGRTEDVDGHPVVEMGLVELYRETGRAGYLELARWFVQARGHGLIEKHGHEPTYFSDRVPVRDQRTVEGHAVRAVYLTAGAADVALETGDDALLQALRRQFAHMLATKTYLTGGLGSRWEGESFGDPYELPPDRAYAETCAAVGGIQWAWRMLLATGDAAYADAAERMLLNGFLAGVSLTGTEYFYVNPLQLRAGAHSDENRSPAHGRRGWFNCACCPPNVMRTVASLGAYLATTDADGIQIQMYAPSTIEADGVRLAVETGYPWDGLIRVRVLESPQREWTLSMRVPPWARGAVLQGDDAEPGGYAHVRRTWQAGDVVELRLPMTVRVTTADERVDAVRGCVALERGPLVYAVEHPSADDLTFEAVASAEFRPELLGGVTVIGLTARIGEHRERPWPYAADRPAWSGERAEVEAVPYFAWANRGTGPMRVWLPDGRR